jgi:hypothetical protein
MPVFENGFLWISWCERCETQQEQWRSDDGDVFRAHCECTDFQVTGLTKSSNGPTVGSVIFPSKVKGIRYSRRLLTVGRHGRLWRECWRGETGVILQSGSDYVAILAGEDHRQVWFASFEGAYYQLVGKPWQGGGSTLL